MVRIPLVIISFAILLSAGYGVARVVMNPVPEEVLKFFNEQASLQCERGGDTLTYPTRQSIKGGHIYSADFLGGRSDNYMIVTETANGLEIEDIHCPKTKANLLAF